MATPRARVAKILLVLGSALVVAGAFAIVVNRQYVLGGLSLAAGLLDLGYAITNRRGAR
jgi:hypothetical protein